MDKEIIIKFGEIFLKGENRRKFEKILLDNIKDKISKYRHNRMFYELFPFVFNYG